MNNLFQNTLHAGVGFAVLTREKAEEVFDELVAKGKAYQAKQQEEKEAKQEAEETTEEGVDAEAVADDTEAPKHTMFEEYEQKLRRLLENTLSKFNFAKSDEHDRIAERIENLEEKLNKLADEALDRKEEAAE